MIWATNQFKFNYGNHSLEVLNESKSGSVSLSSDLLNKKPAGCQVKWFIRGPDEFTRTDEFTRPDEFTRTDEFNRPDKFTENTKRTVSHTKDYYQYRWKMSKAHSILRYSILVLDEFIQSIKMSLESNYSLSHWLKSSSLIVNSLKLSELQKAYN